MKNDNYEFQQYREYIIEYIGKNVINNGRPKREETINNDDILNLKIALETSKDITELCKII